MKYADIRMLCEAGLITEEQRERIIAHYHLKEEGGRFLAIVSFIGAVLIAAGIILLVAANWEEIPALLKIAAGLLLMLGAHAGGWYLHETRQSYRKTGEALHFVGSGLFLGNIALVGQIYHLSSRPPNAILLWWAGIAALPWLLRSKAQHILVLLVFGLWFGLEINQEGSWLYFGNDQRQLLLYALLGLIYLGTGYCLRRTACAEFASPGEKLGLLIFLGSLYPLTWRHFYDNPERLPGNPWLVFASLAVLATGFLIAGLRNATNLTRQWRLTWGSALVGAVLLLALELVARTTLVTGYEYHVEVCSWIMTVALLVFCLLQIQVGLQERSAFMVNLGLVFIALDIITSYVDLIGSMAQTGLMFLVSGVFLIGLGVYLEKKRRTLLRQIRETSP